ncbi:MAG: hypothetical protein MI861_00305 [Pirellulales bacterium]|nr:hypothetical protein [Pirellulales bacterium]
MNRKLLIWSPLMAALLLVTPPRSAVAVDVVMFQQDLIQFTEQSFIQNIFRNQQSFASARKHCEQALKVQIDFVENSVTLTDQQRRKLELAGRGDIHRFFTDVQRVKRGIKFGGIPRDQWQQVWQKTQPLQARYSAGLHGSNSLFAKTISAALEPSQRETFAATKRKREQAIYEDNIRMALSMLDRKVPLTRRQRLTVTELMLKETSPPTFYGEASMHFYVVLFQMTQVPQDELKSIFADNEWQVVDGMLRQAKAMEHTLKLQQEALEE